MFDAVCIGILVADAIAKPVDGIPERGRLSLVDKIELYTGGCAMNAAIDMAKIGLSATVIGKIGDDGFGSFMTGALKKENVDISGLVISKESSTSASVVLSDSGGERTFLHCLGANAEFTDDDIDMDIIAKTDIVFVAGSMLMTAFDGQPCARFLKRCKALGKYTILDTAWDSKDRWMSVLKPCMSYLDVFMPSYEEAVRLSGGLTDPEAIADSFIALGVKTAIIKLGKDGCFIKDSDSGIKRMLPTYSEIKPVDTTGAGDAFCAGFITGLAKGFTLVECCEFANAVGTFCVMDIGASTGIRSFDEIKEFMAAHKAG